MKTLFSEINLGRQALASKESGETGGGLNRLIRKSARAEETLLNSYYPFASKEAKKFKLHPEGGLEVSDLYIPAYAGLREAIKSFEGYGQVGHFDDFHPGIVWSFEKFAREKIWWAVWNELKTKTVKVADGDTMRYVLWRGDYNIYLKSIYHGTI